MATILSRLPLRARLVMTALIAVVPALAVLLYTQVLDRDHTQQRVLDENRRLMLVAANQQAGVFAGVGRFMTTLSEFPGLRTADAASCGALLPAVSRNHPGFINVWLGELDGTTVCAAVPLDRHREAELAKTRPRRWLQRAIESTKPVIGEYQTSALTNQPSVIVALALRSASGVAVRVLAVLVELDQLNRLASTAKLPAGADFTIFDRSRTILARYPDSQGWIGQVMPSSFPVVGLDAGASRDVVRVRGADGVGRLYLTTPIEGDLQTGLYVAMGLDPVVAFAESNRQLRRTLGLLALMSLATVLFAGFGGRVFVLRPIEALQALTSQLASGELSARARLAAGVPGLKELGGAINEMAAALETRDQKLRESEDRYRHLFDQNPLPMWVCDLETLAFLEVNAAALSHYGYTREEFLGMTTADIRPAEDLPRLLARIKEDTRDWSFSSGWRHRLKSGTLIDVDAASHKLTFAGRPCALVVAQDVTERTRAERDLAEQYAITAMTADVASALNEQGLRWPALQTSAEAFVTRLGADVVRIWTTDAKTRTLELQASAGHWKELDGHQSRISVGDGMIGRIAASGHRLFVIDLAKDPDGDCETPAIEAGLRAFSGYPLTVQNRVTGVVGVYTREPLSPTAMTGLAIMAEQLSLGIERYRTEDARRLLASIVEDSEDAVISNMPNGTILSWNAGAERLYGYTASEMIGRSPAVLLPDDRRGEVDDFLARMRAGEHVRGFETVRRRKDGSTVAVSLTLSPIRNETGFITGVSAIVRDLTDVVARRELEDELRQAQKIEAVGQLAGGIAHDFNNLLTVIQGHGQFLLEDLPAGDPRRVDAEEIVRTSGRAAGLTRQLLAFGRKQVLAPRVLRLGAIISDLAPMLERVIGENMELKITTDDRAFVKADGVQIEQVIVNLAVNARDAMPAGGLLLIEAADVTLTEADLRRHPSLHAGPHVMLSVADSGCGIDARTQARMFEPFFTTKPKEQGTGLGLATVYGIVRQSGGSIAVDSEVGRGTTFRLYFPCTDEIRVVERSTPALPSRGGAETIVIVEDEDAVRELVARTLDGLGYLVHTFSRPSQALEFVERDAPDVIDLVISDVVLPEMTGVQMAASFRKRHPEARLLFMSGYAGTCVDQITIDATTGFLPKPFPLDALAAKVREILEPAAACA